MIRSTLWKLWSTLQQTIILYCMFKKITVFKIASCSSSFHSFLFPFFAIQWLRSTTVNVTDSVKFPRHCERASAASTKGHDWSFYFLSSSHKAAHKQQLLFSTAWSLSHSQQWACFHWHWKRTCFKGLQSLRKDGKVIKENISFILHNLTNTPGRGEGSQPVSAVTHKSFDMTS